MTGRTTDGADALPGVTVTATSLTRSGARATAVTDSKGHYELRALEPGRYAVKFELMGFQTVESSVTVAAASVRTVNAALPQATVAETITVTGDLAPTTVTATMATISTGDDPNPLRYSAPANRSYVTMTQPTPGVARAGVNEVRNADQLLVVEATGSAVDTDLEGEDEEQPTRAALQAQTAKGEELGELPLRHTEVKTDIAAFMARTVIEQEYANPFKEPIEAVYVFPLGAMAAVNDFVMEVGSRRIVGVVRPREEAEQIYREARERGQTASLLTQERPNIFTQSVANIAPGRSVKITITTFETLAHDRGTYEYVFPMVVGPRYIPGPALAPTPRITGGGGWSAPTTVVPDADRITPPVLKPGERSGHDISLTVSLDAGMPVAEVRSVSHAVDIEVENPSRRTISLAKADSIPNRDFVLRWSVTGERMHAGTIAYRDRGPGYVAMLVQPPLAPKDDLVSAREITFVLDISGSMSGVPIETSKAMVRRALDALRPSDVFNIFTFSGGNAQLWAEPHGSAPENVAEAKRFLDALAGGGGTEMLAGLKRAISGTHDPARLQMVVFCTDGFVGDEERILAFVKHERGETRFFAFGIGSSVNRFLIDGIGRLGAGASMVVLPRDPAAAESAADSFFSQIDAPVLVDAAIDWNGLPVVDAYPQKLGDLFTGGALTVVARYTKPAEGVAFLTGRIGTTKVRLPIALELPRNARDHAELAPVWARSRIADLSDRLLSADEEQAKELKETITKLAIEHRLASQFTSFVAVDETEVRSNGKPTRIHQPVPMPGDVRYEGVFGPPR